jgi:hypothetical protein
MNVKGLKREEKAAGSRSYVFDMAFAPKVSLKMVRPTK